MPFKTPHPLYFVWQGMIRRCYAPKAKAYPDYGGRGIAVCDRWRGPDGFANFISDMAPRPDGYSLDRRDNDRDYSPENCRWATRKEQQRNQRVTRRVVIQGCEYIAAELADLSGLKTDTIILRASRGLSYEAVVSPQRRVYSEGLALGGLANGLRQKSKTHCPQGHSYAEHGTYNPKGWRYCMECKRIKQYARFLASKTIG